MSSEQLLLTGLTTVVSALVYVSRLLWQRSEKCEQERAELREEMEAMKTDSGELAMFRRCKLKDCPFKPAS